LANAFALSISPANLLGRARVREHQRKAFQKHDEKRFRELKPHVEMFKDPPDDELKPMAPEKAVSYFKSLVPSLQIEPARFGQQMRRDSFTLALATDKTMLERVQQIIGDRLENGEAATGPKAIQEVLNRAGVTPKNPQYAEMVWRTNVMDAYTVGGDEERQDPDVADTFPVWRFDGPADVRERDTHRPHNGHYFPNDVNFAEVRDSIKGEYDGYNCRHSPTPIDKWQWKELQKKGKTVSTFAERFCGGRGSGRPGPCPIGGGHPGAAHGSRVKIKRTKERAFEGEPVKLKTQLTKQETGRVGEAVALAYLQSQGKTDAKPMNTGATNFPIDLIQDHAPTEIKAGLASNGKDAQKWRLTFSQESAKEKELYAKMSPQERSQWNAAKQARIRQRKEKVLRDIEKSTGKKVSPRTMTVIINPDKKVADVYEFEGWHDIIRWNSPQAKAAYKGSVTYAHK